MIQVSNSETKLDFLDTSLGWIASIKSLQPASSKYEGSQAQMPGSPDKILQHKEVQSETWILSAEVWKGNQLQNLQYFKFTKTSLDMQFSLENIFFSVGGSNL
jgi:hypothetical protein